MAGNAAPLEESPELLTIFARLYEAYGPQHWWPSQSAFETIVGAVLTQSTAWSNVERAVARLSAADALSPGAISALDTDALAELVRPSGYYRAKARKLKAFCLRLEQDFGGCLEALLSLPAETLRTYLLATHGIGPETADAIVLYAAGKLSFVVDAYTVRIFTRLGITPQARGYDAWRRYFMDGLPSDPCLFNEYHALIVQHAKVSCRTRPRCAGCAIRLHCPLGASADTATEPAPDASGSPARHAIP